MKRRGRPALPADERKVSMSMRYDRDVIEAFKATGEGWQTRMNDAPRVGEVARHVSRLQACLKRDGSGFRQRKPEHVDNVFVYRGRPVHQTTTAAWKKVLKRAGIREFRWHDLRHTWASWHVQRGTPLQVLKELGGWETMEMVQRYAHLSADHLAHWVAPLTAASQPKLAAI
jgi:integrase